jgi:WXG100 family type VII secretion target
MARKIFVDPSKLESASKEVLAKADEYEQIFLNVYRLVDSLSSAWKGQDNQEFANRVEGFRDDFVNMKLDMIKFGDFLRESALAYRVAQQDVVNRAKSLIN